MAALVVMVLASFVLTALFSTDHDHDQLSAFAQDLPTYSAGHSSPDPTSHVEAATRLEASHCVGCLQRQRERATDSRAPQFDWLVPSSATPKVGPDRPLQTQVHQLPDSRAPPRA